MMKPLLTAVLLLLLPFAVRAQSPHNGEWKVDADRTVWSDGQLPKGFSLTVVLDVDERRIHYRSVNDTNPGDPKRNDFIIPLDGLSHPLPGYSRYNQVRGRQLSPDEYEVLKLNDGDVIVAEFWRFLPGGKELVRRGVGKSPAGLSKAFEEYFVRSP